MSGVSATPFEVMQTWGKCGHSGTYISTSIISSPKHAVSLRYGRMRLLAESWEWWVGIMTKVSR
jgi:hypothetical protein